MLKCIDIDLVWWYFGNTRYRSGEAKEEQYVLRLADETMTIRRKTQEAYPGMFVVILESCISSLEVARDSTRESFVATMDAQLKNAFVSTTDWCKLTSGDTNPPKRFFAVFDQNQPGFRQNWARAIFRFDKWANVVKKSALVYGGEGPGGVKVLNKDIRRLDDERWLNDTIIETGLRRWYDNLKQDYALLAEKIHIFSSYFFSKIYRADLRADHSKVRVWTNKIDIFNLDYVIVPINSNNIHWFLAVIRHPRHVLDAPPAQYPPLPASWKEPCELDASSDLPKCQIIILDSLGMHRGACIRALREYLQDEAQVPQQPNGVDCGVYLLLFVEVFVAHADQLLKSSSVLDDLWNEYTIEGRRDEFKKFLEEESRQWKLKNADKNMQNAQRAFSGPA